MSYGRLRGIAAAGVLVLSGIAFTGHAEAASTYPEVIDLPAGWLPEGIAIGRGQEIFSGSRADGAIYRADLRTGEGRIVVPGQSGRVAVGLSFDERSGYLFVAGGGTGAGYVYDVRTGATVASYAFAAAPTFVNDVIVTRQAAWFTDSQNAALYRVPLEANGDPAAPSEVETVPLTGDWQQQPGFNANGIEATANGRTLVVVQSNTGKLFRVDPGTGVATEIDLGGASVGNGDGILLHGRTLYVVRNRNNLVTVIRLAPDLSSGTVLDELTDPDLDVPTTIAASGRRLYAVNGRFSTPPTPSTPYQIVRVN